MQGTRVNERLQRKELNRRAGRVIEGGVRCQTNEGLGGWMCMYDSEGCVIDLTWGISIVAPKGY